MNRRSLLGRFVAPLTAQTPKRPDYFRAVMEPLEARQLLSVSTLQWVINSAASSVTLTLPDTNATITDGISAQIQLRNQNNANASWNSGNSAVLSGSVAVDYVDGGQVQFKSGASNLHLLDTNSWRPNIGTASVNPGYQVDGDPNKAYPSLYSNWTWTPNDDNNQGTFLNSNPAPAAFGARINGVLFTFLNSDVAYLTLSHITEDIGSDILPITNAGAGVQNFSANTASIGINGGSAALYGLNFGGLTQIPSFLFDATDFLGALPNATVTGAITSTGALTRHLSIAINVPVNVDLGANITDGPIKGSIIGSLQADVTLQAPTIDLNGAGTAGTGYTNFWTSGGGAGQPSASGPVNIADAAAGQIFASSANLTSVTVKLTSFTAGDVLSANTSGTSVTQSYSNGTLTLSGNDLVTNYEKVLDSVKYTNTVGTPGVATKSVQVTASDTFGLSSSIATATININAPVLDLNGDGAGTSFPTSGSATYVIGGAAVNVVGLAGSAPNNGTAKAYTANLTKVLVGLSAAQAGDVLSATTTGTSVSQTFGGGTLTLSGSDTLAHYQQVLDSITFSTTGPTSGVSETITFVATDSNGAVSPAVTAKVQVDVAPQVLPNGVNNDITVFWNNDPATNVPVNIVTTGVTIKDADSATLSKLVVTLTAPVPGDVLHATAVGGVTITGNDSTSLTITGSASVANYISTLATITFNTTDATTRNTVINITATDDVGAVSGTATSTIHVNDDPPLVDLDGPGGFTTFGVTWTSLANTPVNLTAANALITDFDSANLTQVTITDNDNSTGDILTAVASGGIIITLTGPTEAPASTMTLSGTASPAAYSLVLQSVKFNTTTLQSRGIPFNIVATDDLAHSGSAVASVFVDPAAPVLDLNGPGTGGNGYAGTWTVTSNTAVAVVDPTATLTDSDSAQLSTASSTAGLNITRAVVVSIVSPSVGDRLTATPSNGVTVSFPPIPPALTTPGTNGNQLSLTGSTNAASFQTVLRTLNFNTTTVTHRVVTIKIVSSDDGFNTSTTQISTIEVDPNPPQTDLNGGLAGNDFSTSWTSLANTAVNISDPAAATVTDPDSVVLTQMTASVANPSAGDALTATGGGGVTVTGNGTSTLTLSGSALAGSYQTVLRTLKFNTTTTTTRAVTVNVKAIDDGNYIGNIAVATINVVGAAPTVDLNGAGAGTGFTNTWTNAGPVLITDPTGVVADTDGNLTQLIVSISSPSAGDKVHATAAGGITVTGNDTANLTLSGNASAAAYTGVLTGMTFNTTTLTNRAVSINVQATDDGGLTSNVAISTINVSVVVNLPPALDLNGAGAGTGFTTNWLVTPGVASIPVVITDAANATAIDTDSANLTQLIVKVGTFHTGDVLGATTTGTTITQTYSNGTLTLSGSDTVAHYQQVLRTVTYNNTAGGPGVNSFPVTFVANDGTTTSSTVTATVQVPPVIRLNAVNGANFSTTWYNNGNSPSGLANGAVALGNMAQATVTDGAGLANITSMTVALTTFVAGDVLTVPIVAGVAITATYSGGTLTLSGNDTLAHYQQELRLISYNNTNNGPGVTQKKATFVASDGTVTGNAITSTINISLPTGTQVLANRLFYNNSRYDGHTPTGTVPGDSGVNSFDDAAIASDKTGLVVFANGASVPGTATFANVSSFSKGITGVIIDVVGGIGTHSLINRSSGDITFKIAPASVGGTYNQLSTWTGVVPTAASVSVRVGAGIGGSDRIEITWASSIAVKNNWLEINLKSTSRTGISSDYAFIYGSDVGNSGLNDPAGQSKTEAFDGTAPTTNTLGFTTQVFQIMDYDKDGQVNATDSVTASSNNGQLLVYLRNPTGPYAPDGGAPSASPAAVAAALPASNALSSGLTQLGGLKSSGSDWLGLRLQSILLPAVTKALQSVQGQQLLHSVEEAAGKFHINDSTVDDLLAELGLHK